MIEQKYIEVWDTLSGLLVYLEMEGPIRVTAYVDASFATHNSDMKSHTGVCLLVKELSTVVHLSKS